MRYRKPAFVGWLAAAAMFLLPIEAQADTQARITDVSPSESATLGAHETFYVRIEYTTDEPVALWARPFLHGQEVKQAHSNASPSYTGSGAALGWFELIQSGDVDEVRVRAGGGKPYREWEVARLPVSLHWESRPPSARSAEPAWVGELRAEATARMNAQFERAASAPISARDFVLFNVFMIAALGIGIAGIVAPLWSWWKWRGGWRVAAAVPALLMIFVILRIVIDGVIDPTSHNMLPFEILMFSAIALAMVGVLKVLRWVMGVKAR